MTPKEKAKELIDKYKKQLDTATPTLYRPIYQAKQCALIAVDEILNLMIKTFKWDINYNGNIDYWQEVKTEINQL